MASTNKTENFGLNRWVASDSVQMEDFNADNAKIDAALGELKAVARVKLFDISFSEYTSSYHLDLSEIDLDQFMELDVYADLTNDHVSFRVNNVSSTKYVITNADSNFSNATYMYMAPGMNRVVITKSKIYCLPDALFKTYSYKLSSGSKVNTLDFFADNSTSLREGDRLIVWGVKK